METPKLLSVFSIDDDLMNQWFDSFHPSIRTFATNFVINKLKQYNFNPDIMEDDGDVYFANLLAKHFAAFLDLKMMDANPGCVITDWHLMPPS